MKVTLNLEDDLVEDAREYTGIQDVTALIHESLKALLAREASRRLAALGRTQPNFRAAPRRRRRRIRRSDET